VVSSQRADDQWRARWLMSINLHLSDFLINDFSRPFIDGIRESGKQSSAGVVRKGKGLSLCSDLKKNLG